MVELALVVLTMNEVGDDRADQRRGSADSSKVEQERAAHAKSRDCHLEVDTFWQTQPMQCCKGVHDVVITTHSINQTSRGVNNRLELPLLVSRKPDQDNISRSLVCTSDTTRERKQSSVTYCQ